MFKNINLYKSKSSSNYEALEATFAFFLTQYIEFRTRYIDFESPYIEFTSQYIEFKTRYIDLKVDILIS